MCRLVHERLESEQRVGVVFLRYHVTRKIRRHSCQTCTNSLTKIGATECLWLRLSASRRSLPGARLFTCLVCLPTRSPVIPAGPTVGGLAGGRVGFVWRV